MLARVVISKELEDNRGFHSLKLQWPNADQPSSERRTGMNLPEGVEKVPRALNGGVLCRQCLQRQDCKDSLYFSSADIHI